MHVAKHKLFSGLVCKNDGNAEKELDDNRAAKHIKTHESI